jgi:hypothetical protein
MGSPDALIRATVNRQEWDLFQEEVQAEAERIEHGETITADGDVAASTEQLSSQERIDLLRATVAEISRSLEVQT